MAISEIRTQIYLRKAQHEALKRAAEERSVSMAQLVREAVTAYLSSEDGTALPRMEADEYLGDSAWKLPQLAERFAADAEGSDPRGEGWAEVAERHDDYLYDPGES